MIDLDAAKAARREAAGEAPTLTFGGETFKLPVELPFEVGHRLISLLENIATGTSAVFDDVEAILRPLLGESYPAFMAHGPSMGDVMALLTGLPGEYGFTDMGGIAGLGAFVAERFEATEAAFQGSYGIDLSAALWGHEPLGMRRLRALLINLPPDSAVHRAMREEPKKEFSSREDLDRLARMGG